MSLDFTSFLMGVASGNGGSAGGGSAEIADITLNADGTYTVTDKDNNTHTLEVTETDGQITAITYDGDNVPLSFSNGELTGVGDTDIDVSRYPASNLYFGNTAPTDTNKVWVKCATPESISIKKTNSISNYTATAFSATGKNVHRAGQWATDDAIYVFGGAYPNNEKSNKILKYTFATETWETLSAQLPETERSAIIGEYNGDVFIIGGFDSYYRDTISKFNIENETITSAGTGSRNLATSGFCMLGKYIYIVGGENNRNNVYKFDCENNTITQIISNFPISVTMPSVVPVETDIYILGGASGWSGTYYNTIYKLNTLTNSVTLIGFLPIAVMGANAILLNNKIYLFGGETSSSTATNKVYCYDITTNETTALADLSYYPSAQQGCVNNDILYLIDTTSTSSVTGTTRSCFKIEFSNANNGECELITGDTEIQLTDIFSLYIGKAYYTTNNKTVNAPVYVHNGTSWVEI